MERADIRNVTREACVCLVEQPIQGFAAPSDPHVDVGTEREADALQTIEIRMPGLPSLDLRDERS